MSDMNGRQDSEAPSSSNGSDFYNIDAHDAGQSVAPGTTTIVSKEDEIPTRPSHDPDDADDEDSSSEMDFSASSRASSTEPGDVALPHAGIKRKLTDGPEDSSTLAATIAVKKRKLPTPPPPEPRKESPGFAGLPGELWQQVLLHLPPAMLCRCLRVCRTFHTYLTDTKADSAAKKDQAKVRVLDSEAIWIHARKLFFPNLPRPLERCSELEMLQLVGGRSCQICFKPPVPSPCTTPFNCGPGHVGQRVFWPFGVRACGNCITGITLRVSTVYEYSYPTATNVCVGRPNPRHASCQSSIWLTLCLPNTRPSLCIRDSTSSTWRYSSTPPSLKGLLRQRHRGHLLGLR